MKTTLVKLSALFFAITLLACNKVSEEDLTKISALEQRVLIIEEKVTAIDVTEVETIAETVESNMNFMTNNYSDMSNLDFVIETLSDYRAIRKPMAKFSSKHKSYIDAIAFAKTQLKNLKSDATAGKFSAEELAGHIASEENAIKTIEDKANAGCDQVTALTSRFEELNPSIVTEMEKIK